VRAKGRMPDGSSFPFHVHDVEDQHVSRLIETTGRWEPFTTRILASLLNQGDGVLDIGANIGWYSVVLGKIVGPTGYVHAFEPDPLNTEVLRNNIEENGLRNVWTHAIALADRSGQMELTISKANLGDHRLSTNTTQGRHSVPVVVERLDSLLEQCPPEQFDRHRLRVIKIDTQGAEVMILNGAVDLLATLPGRCALLVEFAPNLLATHGPDQVEAFIELLASLKRSMFSLRRASIRPVDADWLRKLATKLRPLGDEWAVDILVAPDIGTDLRQLQRYRIPRPIRFV
jgi:FkbM family methyltransferase